MRQIFKQRIVGAVVLVALGVIFLPFLFTLEPPRPVDTSSQIPPAPDIEPVEVYGPARVEPIPPPKPPEEAFVPSEPEMAAATQSGGGERHQATPGQGSGDRPTVQTPPAGKTAEERPSLAGNTLQSWVVQVASVRDQDAANNLRDRLLTAGHKAYVRSALAGGGTTYRVFVGPMSLKERALADKTAIDQAFGVQSMVVRFEP